MVNKYIFIVALFTIARGWKQLKCPSTGEWINKMGYIHTREYHTALKRKETLMQATTQINLENSMLREIKGQILYDSIYEILLLLFICYIPVQLFTTPWVAGLLCPSLSPGVCSNSCLLSWWCHPTISSSLIPFSSCPQSFPGSVFSNESDPY